MKRCHYCHVEVGATKDHIVPKSWGGRGHYNFVPACGPCNNAKSDNAPTCMCERCVNAVQKYLHRGWALLFGMDPASLAFRRQAKRMRTLEIRYGARVPQRLASLPTDPASGVASDQRGLQRERTTS